MSTPAYAALPAREREMLRLYVEEGLTYREIGKRYYYSGARVAQLLSPFLTAGLRANHKQNHRKSKPGYRRRERWHEQLESIKPRFVEMINDGADGSTIIQELSLNAIQLTQLVNQVGPATRKRWQAVAGVRAGGNCRYSEADKLAALRQAAALNGGRIGVRSYERLRPAHPHWPSAILLSAGEGWNSWIRRAGLPISERQQHLGLPTYSEAACREAVRRIYHQYGRLPSLIAYEDCRQLSEPTAARLRVRFGYGRWVAALEYLLPEAFEQSTQTTRDD